MSDVFDWEADSDFNDDSFLTRQISSCSARPLAVVNFGKSATAAAAVPEPNAATLLLDRGIGRLSPKAMDCVRKGMADVTHVIKRPNSRTNVGTPLL